MINFLSEQDRVDLSIAIEKAESKTSGEIIPMIVRRSSMIGHVAPQLFLFFLVMVLSAYIILKEVTTVSPIALEVGIGIGVFFSVALSLALQRVAWIQRLFTPLADRSFEVLERAKLEFYESKIHKTKHDTGVLIFISLMEKECVVLAGEAIANKMPAHVWDEVVRLALNGIKNKKPAEGLSEAIELCGNILAQHFPIKPGDRNELSNVVIVKE